MEDRAAAAGKDSIQMSDDPNAGGGKRLQIDDLIIIPNNTGGGGAEGAGGGSGSGSALQNLAKIASRYQDTGSNAAASAADGADSQPLNLPSPQKKPRLDHHPSQKPPSSNLTATQLAGTYSSCP